MNSTVSDRIAFSTPGNAIARIVGSSVANSRSSAITPAPVNRLNSVDLPRIGVADQRDNRPRRAFAPFAVQAAGLAHLFEFAQPPIRCRIIRRSASIWVSPGPPRKPNPPRCRSRWVQLRTSRLCW